jgi:hypothetical protein
MEFGRMKKGRADRFMSGVSLMETVVAMGVLAVAVPLALAAMSKAGSVGSSARAETRAPAIAERCLLEVKAARRGESEVLPVLQPAVSFPGGGEVLVLGFSREGRLLGEVDAESYESGMRDELDGETVNYVASISGRFDNPGVTLTVRVEHPAVQRRAKRSGVDFHTKLP